MALVTLNDVFFTVVQREHPRVMIHRQSGVWTAISSRQLHRTVAGVSGALRNLGVGRGDRVAILSENRSEWAIADFACLLLGAVVVPIYATLTADQAGYILRDSGARTLFVSSNAQLQKMQPILPQTSVDKTVVMDSDTACDNSSILPMQRWMNEEPKTADPALDLAAHQVGAGDLATIIYTSGTTGTPKGVMLTHGNMASNINCSLSDFSFEPGNTSISFLPLSHVTARHVDFAMLYHGVTLAYVPFVDQLPQALLEVRPSIFVGVPRVYEKIHTQVLSKATGAKRRVYQWALSVGRAHESEIFAGQTPASIRWRIADRLVFSKVRAGMGGGVELCISGGAPLGRELARWYADIGICVHQGYGLTETSPVIAVNTPIAHKLGTVGRPLSNVQVQIAEDGEIMVRGPSVFRGYWNLPQETSDAFLDGWFKTGDIGNLDADGFLSVTDRKKDLIKTSGGKFIAPQPIENSLKHDPLIAEAVVIGDRRKFPAVLIVPYFPLLEEWARNHQIPFSSRQELVGNDKVRALFDGIVAVLNQSLARFEQLKRVMLVPEEFTAQDGTLTASMKLRRRVVEDRYSEQIEDIYAQAEAAGLLR